MSQRQYGMKDKYPIEKQPKVINQSRLIAIKISSKIIHEALTALFPLVAFFRHFHAGEARHHDLPEGNCVRRRGGHRHRAA